MVFREKNLTLLIPTRTSPQVVQVVREAKALPIDIDVVVVGYKIPPHIEQSIVGEGGVFFNEIKKGKGIAIINAFSRVTTKYVMIIDADGTYPVADVPKLLKCLQKGGNVVVGYRRRKTKGSMTTLHKVGNLGLCLIASVLYGYWIKDICSGMWGFRTEDVQKFNLISRGFTLEAEFFINARERHLNLAQVPIGYVPRTGGKAKVTVRDGLKIGWFLVRSRIRGLDVR